MKKPRFILQVGARLIAGLLALLFICTNLAPVVGAVSLSQGYHSSQAIPGGAVVSLTKNGSNDVQLTDFNNEDLMLGVAVDSQNAMVDLQPSGSDIRVGISGEIPVLVTDVGGNINSGDNLIISQIAGVAMKDDKSSTAKKYVGVASQAFSSNSIDAKKVSIKDGNSTKQVSVGLIKAKILLSDRQSSPKTNPILSYIQHFVGRPVSTAQIVGAAAVFVITFAFTGFLLSGSIKGSFVSLGRNPLSKPAIISNMLRVSMIALVIFGAGVAVAYIILLV